MTHKRRTRRCASTAVHFTTDMQLQKKRRNFYQIQQWKGSEKTFKATDWSWIVKDKCHVPKMTDLPAAPVDLLSVIRCNCNKNCNLLRCSCRKNGLERTSVCGVCKVSTCQNSVDITVEALDASSD